MNDKSLRHSTVSGVMWNVAGNGGQLVAQFVLFVVLARQLGPGAFGIVGIALVVLDILVIVGRCGLTEVLIQQPEVSEREASTAFWTGTAIGVAITAAMIVAAGPIAAVYGLPELGPILRWLSLSAVVYAAGAVYEAKMRSAFDFKRLAARNLSATIVSGTAALIAAFAGLGPYSLVVQRLVSTVWLFVAMVVSTGWLPRLRFDPTTARDQLRRGWGVAAATLLGTGNQKVIDLIVGYVLGSVPLGYLRIAWRALELLNQVTLQPMTAVALTSLARLQADPEAFRRAYEKIVALTAGVTYPIFAGAAVVSPSLVLILFGEHWGRSIVPMQILALTGLFAPLFYYNGIAFIAIGRMRSVMLVNLIEFLISALCAGTAARYGLTWAAMGNVLRTALIAPISMAAMWAICRVPPRDTIRLISPAAGASLLMIALIYPVYGYLAALAPLLRLALTAGLGMASYIAALRLLGPGMFDELRQLAWTPFAKLRPPAVEPP